MPKSDNVQVIPDAGDVVIVGADTIAKLSAQTSKPRSFAAWDQRSVIHPFETMVSSSTIAASVIDQKFKLNISMQPIAIIASRS